MNIPRIIKSSLIVFLSFLLCLGLSNSLFNKWQQLGWMVDINQFGDLYRMTNLINFKEESYRTNSTLEKIDYLNKSNKTELYIIGDSFTYDIDTSQYVTEKANFVRVGVEEKTLHLDKSKNNILVIQNVERGIASRLANDSYQYVFLEKSGFFNENKPKIASEKSLAMLSDFGTSNIENKLQAVFFDYSPILKLRELKAQLNYMLFGRISSEHVVSNDEKSIHYQEEVKGKTSSFVKVSETKLNDYVTNAKEINNFYKSQGFNEVYFAFIPNKVSICASKDGKYNHLIERLQALKSNEFKTIDFYVSLKGHPEYYHLGDGHWNNKGKALFVSKVNRLLR